MIAPLSAKWWYSAPLVTPAAATISSIDVAAHPFVANRSRAASRTLRCVAPERSACVANSRRLRAGRESRLRLGHLHHAPAVIVDDVGLHGHEPLADMQRAGGRVRGTGAHRTKEACSRLDGRRRRALEDVEERTH